MAKPQGTKPIVENRRSRYDYELLDLTIGDIAREVQERVRSGPSRPGANPSSQ